MLALYCWIRLLSELQNGTLLWTLLQLAEACEGEGHPNSCPHCIHANGFMHLKAMFAAQSQIPELPKQEEKSQADRAGERIRAIKVWRGEAAERASASREMRVARNRHVLRAHERLLREKNRLKEDDRTRRMEALKVQLIRVGLELSGPHPAPSNAA